MEVSDDPLVGGTRDTESVDDDLLLEKQQTDANLTMAELRNSLERCEVLVACFFFLHR
jgi:hypothetical protein